MEQELIIAEILRDKPHGIKKNYSYGNRKYK